MSSLFIVVSNTYINSVTDVEPVHCSLQLIVCHKSEVNYIVWVTRAVGLNWSCWKQCKIFNTNQYPMTRERPYFYIQYCKRCIQLYAENYNCMPWHISTKTRKTMYVFNPFIRMRHLDNNHKKYGETTMIWNEGISEEKKTNEEQLKISLHNANSKEK